MVLTFKQKDMSFDDFNDIESRQRQHHNEILHREKLYLIIEEQEYLLFSMLKPKIQQDGNQWCVLYGDDLMTGIAGFGDTPYLAILDWNRKWHKNINTKTK